MLIMNFNQLIWLSKMKQYTILIKKKSINYQMISPGKHTYIYKRDNDPEYFKSCKISVNALIKMLIHSCLGSKSDL